MTHDIPCQMLVTVTNFLIMVDLFLLVAVYPSTPRASLEFEDVKSRRSRKTLPLCTFWCILKPSLLFARHLISWWIKYCTPSSLPWRRRVAFLRIAARFVFLYRWCRLSSFAPPRPLSCPEPLIILRITPSSHTLHRS